MVTSPPLAVTTKVGCGTKLALWGSFSWPRCLVRCSLGGTDVCSTGVRFPSPFPGLLKLGTGSEGKTTDGFLSVVTNVMVALVDNGMDETQPLSCLPRCVVVVVAPGPGSGPGHPYDGALGSSHGLSLQGVGVSLKDENCKIVDPPENGKVENGKVD